MPFVDAYGIHVSMVLMAARAGGVNVVVDRLRLREG